MAKSDAKLKEKTPNKVSDETLDQKMTLTTDGFSPDSEEAKELEKQRDFLGTIAKPSFEASKNARRKYDQEWIARNLFWRGYQFSRYPPNSDRGPFWQTECQSANKPRDRLYARNQESSDFFQAEMGNDAP